MLDAGAGKFMMNFISHNYYLVLEANISQLLQFFTAPYSAYRVMRGAEYKDLHMVSLNLGFEILKVYMVGTIFIY